MLLPCTTNENPTTIQQYLETENSKLIFCEEQSGNYCGRHVLRALFQGKDKFDDKDLGTIAETLAKDEENIAS